MAQPAIWARAQARVTEQEVLGGLAVGHRVWFAEERRGYTVQARSARFIICTKPMPARKTVLYTVIDCHTGMRGPDDRVFGGGGYETREDCLARLAEFSRKRDALRLSRRREIRLLITRTQS